MELPGPTDISVFLDTTELHSQTAYVTTPRHVTRYDEGQRSFTRISYYVSRLTVEERAFQLRKDFGKALKQFERLIAKLTAEPNLAYFRDEITADLMAVPNLTMFDEIPHGVVEQKLLFEARHHGHYKDAMIFSSAIAYAKANSLPRCIFVTDDKKKVDFPALEKTLSLIYPMEVMTKATFADRLQFDAKLYDNITSRLQPKLENQAKLARCELVNHVKLEEFDSPEAYDAIEALRGNSDLSSIFVEVTDIAISTKEPFDPKRPTEVACSMSVRYYIPDVWSRLFWANASVKLAYSEGDKLADVEVADFKLDLRAYA